MRSLSAAFAATRSSTSSKSSMQESSRKDGRARGFNADVPLATDDNTAAEVTGAATPLTVVAEAEPVGSGRGPGLPLMRNTTRRDAH